MCRKFECRKDIHYKTQTGTSCEICNSKAFRLGIEPASSGLLDQCSTTDLHKSLPTTWARVQYIYIYIYINEMVMPVKYKGILIIIFCIYTRCQQMKVKVICRKFECRKDIHYKTQTGTSCEICNSKAFRLGIEPASSGLLATIFSLLLSAYHCNLYYSIIFYITQTHVRTAYLFLLYMFILGEKNLKKENIVDLRSISNSELSLMSALVHFMNCVKSIYYIQSIYTCISRIMERMLITLMNQLRKVVER